MKKKLAKLNKKEDDAWIYAFNFYLGQGNTEKVADKKAWKEIQTNFPRLKKYEGCLPE